MERTVVGVDRSEAARTSLQWAVDETRRRDAVVEAILAWHHLLVADSRGRGGFRGLLLGSVSQQTAHHAPCPVVNLPPAA